MDHRKLALIHIIKKELGLPDEEYRRILQTVAGVSSSKDLSEAGFRKLLRYFVRSHFYIVNRRGLTLRQKLFIDHLQRNLGWDGDHLRNFLRKYYHRDAVLNLSRAEASHAILSLKRVLQHRRMHPAPQERQ